ncbi:alpha/beta fold hydrolase [Simiduia aestuariiviva]|uniref:Cholesterol oxidase n=1 Tax=Simiduia aestuariiviva TaxID=1510459 RepID=A0A839UP62_9GAMM|nr:alpha/beta fold hydrolase [Simiduia aestuariiviva]MBB3167348.1 choline dehydrogenase-like flavoprotein [Simiduia aestuariiviva]
MERASQWLSERFENLVHQATTNQQQIEFDLVIVGSGYGGAVAAATLAGSTQDGKPLRVAVLERGDEFLAGMFPKNLDELPKQVRGSVNSSALGERQGLFDIRANGDMAVLTANGLGGGSLINAGVMAQPLPEVFDGRWPSELKQGAGLDFERTGQLLGALDAQGDPNIIARSGSLPKKYTQLQALKPDATQQAAITVAMTDGDNQAGVAMSACKQCGDCATGCNHGAKNSLDVNLLVQAKRQGAEIYAGVSVSRLRKQSDGSWCLACYYTHDKLRAGQQAPIEIHAQRVIIAAGSLGSTEILMRSTSEELQFSRALGQHFSGNGDAIAVGFQQDNAVNAIAWGDTRPSDRTVGPTITGIVDLRKSVGLIIEEMAVPAPLARIFAELYTTTNSLHNLSEPDLTPHPRGQPTDDPLSLNRRQLGHTALYAIMGNDDADGQLEWPAEPSARQDAKALPEGGLQVRWPGARNKDLFDTQIDQLRNLTGGSVGGRILSNPAWSPLPDKLADLFDSEKGPLLTVHPLGGCAMADECKHGVVDHLGRVFNAAPEGGLHEGLVVLDGAIMPSALGINPALTIAAVALRAAEQLRDLWHWQAHAAGTEGWRQRPVWRDTDHPDTSCDTQIEVNERLNGAVQIDTANGRRTLMAELTLCFAPKAAADYFWTTGEQDRQRRTAQILKSRDGENCSELRLFEPEDWDALTKSKASEAEMAAKALLIAPISGSLEIMHRAQSSARQRIWRAAWAYILNRGLRDFADAMALRVRSWFGLAQAPRVKLLRKLRDLRNLASHSGQVRLFEYELAIHRPLDGWPAALSHLHSAQEHRIYGEKHITYARAANPIQQLTELALTHFPGLAKPTVLAFDNRYLARRDKPLLRIVQQANLVRGFADLISFHCFFVRLLIHTHVWTFRKPDAPEPRQPKRLAGPLAGLPEPEIRELEVDRLDNGLPISIRLTRYGRPENCETPLVMLHGYTASSTTFAHPAIDTSAAEYFYRAGRDVWLVDLRTSCGLLSAMLPWHFEDVAFKDIPLAFATVLEATGAEQCDVIAHCMGAAMLSMAILQAPPAGAPYYQMRDRLPARLRHVVLSQVGPKVSFCPDNMTRGYLLKNVRHLLGNLPYQFRPSEAPKMAESVLDRLLQALPYPRAEFCRENPILPGRRVRWSSTRRRIDALFGRAFALHNMSDRLLTHIDDIFGPLSLGTLAQTIHFALQEQITNFQGENCYATRENLAQRWRFNTLTLHAEDSGLADVGTATLMASAMADIAAELNEGEYTARHHIFKGFGHQDLLIGRGSHKVFRAIEAFFNDPERYKQPLETKAAVRNTPKQRAELPALGPVIGPAAEGRLPVMLGVDPAGRAPEYVLFVRLNAQGEPCAPLDMQNPSLSHNYQLHFAHPAKHQWLKFLLVEHEAEHCAQRWLPLLIHDDSKPLSQLTLHARLPDNLLDLLHAPPPTGCDPVLVAECLKILRGLLPACVEPIAEQLAHPLRPQRELHWTLPKDNRIRLAVAACQYPAMLFDHACAYRSYARLAARLDQPTAPNLLLLIGDQVYVDPTAGMADAQTYFERYVEPYHEWLKQPPVQSVLRRLPSYMMPDDHEIANDWDNQQGRSQHYGQFTPARSSYLLFQRQLNVMPAEPARCHPLPSPQTEARKLPLWQQREFQQLALFLADSRTERDGRTPTDAHRPMMCAAQFKELKDWLAKTPASQPKLVASAAMLLPRRLRSATGVGAACQSDAWDGYPGQLIELLTYIAEQRIQNLVFVSGDEHLSSCVTLTFRHPDAVQRCFSIHSSGLNAPLPFVNTRPEELAGDEVIQLHTQSGLVPCEIHTDYFPGDGFALLSLQQQGQGWELACEFDREGATTEPLTLAW